MRKFNKKILEVFSVILGFVSVLCIYIIPPVIHFVVTICFILYYGFFAGLLAFIFPVLSTVAWIIIEFRHDTLTVFWVVLIWIAAFVGVGLVIYIVHKIDKPDETQTTSDETIAEIKRLENELYGEE